MKLLIKLNESGETWVRVSTKNKKDIITREHAEQLLRDAGYDLNDLGCSISKNSMDWYREDNGEVICFSTSDK